MDTDRIGIAEVSAAVHRGGWIFREQAIGDFGIDAQIESKTGKKGTGRLIALQVKSGESYFREETEGGFIYRGEAKHSEYWLNHSLPVLLLLVDIETRNIFWTQVTGTKMESTGIGWKIEVPKSNLLELKHFREFEKIATDRRTFPQDLIDEMISGDIESLRKMRLFAEYDREGAATRLGLDLQTGHLAGGSPGKRAAGLAWCARILSRSDKRDLAEQFLQHSLELGTTNEAAIAQAFSISRDGNHPVTLEVLEKLGSPQARTAALMILSFEDGNVAALEWMDKRGFDASDFDSDGRFFELHLALTSSNWNRAMRLQKSFKEEDLEQTPVLVFNLAIAKLLEAVPDELRHVVVGGIPLDASNFPFIAGTLTDNSIREALRMFDRAAITYQSLGLICAWQLAEEFSLWVRLSRPETNQEGRKILQRRLRKPKDALGVIPLAIQFGVELDLFAVEQILDIVPAMDAIAEINAAKARFALAQAKGSPREAEAYIDRHIAELCKYFKLFFVRSLQSELWAKAGSIEKAEEFLNLALAEGLPIAEESRLRRIIAEAQGSDPVRERKAQFEESNDLQDLFSLAEALYQAENWNEFSKFGEALFLRTESLRDAERLGGALLMDHQSSKLVELFATKKDLREKSSSLQMHYCWALFREGELLKALSELEDSTLDPTTQNFRTLQMNLVIGLGDWATIPTLLASEFEARDQRTARELLKAAQLGLRTGSFHVRALVEAAAEKAGDDAGVLASAYFLASSAGWEDDSKVSDWLHRAARLSSDDGPLKRVSLNDLVERAPAWEKRESEVCTMLGRADAPLYLIAQQLNNRSLMDLTTFPFMRNLETTDPRRRSVISAFAGNRGPLVISQKSTVGIEATALLTLASLDLLSRTVDSFEKVIVPHSTLSWLFEEKQKVAFHQPSRIEKARRVVELIPKKSLEELTPSAVSSSELASDVGDELAMLIAEARASDDQSNQQRIVVRPGPVHRVGSLMNEEANLTDFADVICSCGAVIEKMLEFGHITYDTANKAISYLRLQERPWSNAPEISAGARLYLDGLAVEYFSQIGLLGEIAPAGFRVFVSPNELSEATQLLSYHNLTSKVDGVIESIRSCVTAGLQSGKIILDRQPSRQDEQARGVSEHPSYGVFGMASRCDLIVSDDRFWTKFVNFGGDDGRVPISTSIDIINHLAERGLLNEDQSRECLTQLRRGGYLFVPLKTNEIYELLSRAPVKGEKVRETAELRAVRENLLRVKMSGWLQLPNEGHWLLSTMSSLREVLGQLWKDERTTESESRARSDWLINLIETRGWIDGTGENKDASPVLIHALSITSLFILDQEISSERRKKFWNWLEGSVLEPIKEREPEVFKEIVKYVKSHISDAALVGTQKIHFGYEDEC